MIVSLSNVTAKVLLLLLGDQWAKKNDSKGEEMEAEGGKERWWLW